MDEPRLRLLTAPALLAPRELPFLPERRFRLAVVLALSPQGCTRDELAALFWPERPQAAARSNLRKLILELRRLDLPGLQADGERLRWDVASDATDLLAGRTLPAAWAEPLASLDGSDSPAFDQWLMARREHLAEAWTARQRAVADSADPATAHAAAQALLTRDPDDAQAQRQAAQARRALDAPDGLVGRGAELAEAVALLGDRRCRVLTLLGPGGVGKSALALALLRQPQRLDADGLHWIALEDLADAAAVPLRLTRELGVAVGARSDGWDEALAALHDRQELLILDNAEHLPTLPALLGRLLAALPRLRLLVTSRQRLVLAGEWVLPIAPLDETAARQLFLAAAREAPARHPPDPADPQLAELLALLGRLPLALRLAAAWTRHLPLATLLAQLRRSLDLLQAGEAVDEHPAHHSLQASFERSWALLEPPLRPVLAALAVGSGTMRLDVAQATGGATAAQIAALADASLVQLDGGGRVGLHPLLRHFGQQRLAAEPGATDAALARHAQAIAGLLQSLGEVDGAGEPALVQLQPERQQIEQAWTTAMVQRRADWLQDMAGPFSSLVQAQGGTEAVLPLFQRAQALLEGPDVALPGALCDVALEHAALHFWRGDHDPCEAAARRALVASRAARLARPMGQALNLMALVALRRGHTERAATLMARGLAQFRRAGHRRDGAIAAGNLSGIRRELGDLAHARATAEEALQAHRALGFAAGEVAALADLAQLAHLQDRLDEAADLIEQAVQAADRHAMPLRRATLLTFLGAVRLDQGRTDEAAALADAAGAEMQRSATRHYHQATLHRLRAEVALARDQVDEARAQLRRACACVAPLAQDVNARGLLWSLAALAEQAGAPPLAAALGWRAECGRPPQARPLPRQAALRDRLPAPAPMADPALRLAIERLLG